ncbi:hypothetical protein F4859DRAFT_119861 [Xylaria cf. heliscus]|nr:hypothetical protein F4859DRAFT_119861 [Xylaria cf. heliscus]
MSEYFDRSTPTLREETWGAAARPHHYPPPRDVNQYVSRALPQPPTRPQSYSSSTYDPEESHSRQHTPPHLLFANGLNNRRKRSTFGGGIDEDALAMVELPEIMIPEDLRSYEYPPLISPRPQRPDSKLISMWANGDELVSPIETPAEANWVNHVVSPLSEGSERWPSSEVGRASMEYESWFDDTSSDEEDEPDSSTWAENEDRFLYDAFPKPMRTQIPRTSLRYSDPGSPLNPSLDWDFGDPGPRIKGVEDASGRQTVQPQMFAQSTYSGDEQSHIRDSDTSVGESKITFAMHRIGTFSSNRHRASQLRVPPPLQLRERSVAQGDYVKTPFPLRASSVSSQRSLSKPDVSSAKLQKRRSGLGGFSSLRRPSAHSIRKPPPGFTEILSQIDYQGTVSPVPRVKNILSKAKHGLGIVRADSKREKRREEPRQTSGAP